MSTPLAEQQSGREHRERYKAFLLRCWLEDEPEKDGEFDEEAAWRFTLVQLEHGHAQKGFTSLETLCVHVRKELEAADEPD
jgi:hypothetical protein